MSASDALALGLAQALIAGPRMGELAAALEDRQPIDAIVSQFALPAPESPLLAEGALIDLFPDWHGERFPLFAFHPSRKHPPAKVRAFIDFCIEIAEGL